MSLSVKQYAVITVIVICALYLLHRIGVSVTGE